MSLRDQLKRNPIIRWLYYNMLAPATGDTIRLQVQYRPLVRMLGTNTGTSLDLGCGGGVFTPHLVRNGSDIYALDFSMDNLRNNRKTLAYESHDRFIHMRGDAQALPFPDSHFDTVLCSEVIEHIQDDHAVERELHRVIKPGGTLVASVPHPPDRNWNPDNIEPGGHVRAGYTLEELKNLFPTDHWEWIEHDYCFLFISRMMFQLLYFTTRRLGVRYPACFTLICRLESLMPWGRKNLMPYDIMVKLKRK